MKKLFTLIVAICATTLAWADDSGSCGENVTYSFVESTGTLTISGTGYMEDFTSSSKVPWNAYRSSIKKVVINNGVTSIGNEAFDGCTALTSVTIPNSVTSIENSTFDGCTGLTSIEIPNSVTSIGNYAFGYCSGLTSIEIPNSVTSIGDYAFGDCTGLTSITIPNSVTSIGLCAFDGTAWYDNQPDGLVYAGNVAYKYKGTMPNDTSVTIKEGTVGIAGSAFSGCTGLTSIEIPNSVTSIGDGAFDDCTGLTSVTIPNSVTSIGKDAFYGCTGLTSITIPNSVTSIGEEAFCGCTGLTSITIPNSVTSIGEWAFYGCTGLTSMTVEATNPPLCVNKYGLGLNMPDYNIPLYVPEASVDAYKAADEWKKFTNIQAIPNVGVKEATAEKSEVKKVIDRNGIIYIEKDGTRYFLNGGKVE